MSQIKEQLDAVCEEMQTWPAWRKAEIAAEVAKTPFSRNQLRAQREAYKAWKRGEDAPHTLTPR